MNGYNEERLSEAYELVEYQDDLTEWEKTFVQNLIDTLEIGRALTGKQINTLNNIRERLQLW